MKKKRMNVSRRADRTVLFRTFTLMALFGVFLFVPLVWQLYQIQIVKSEEYERMAVEEKTREDVIRSVRGNIYDRNNAPLAINVGVSTVFVSPETIETEEQRVLIAQGLSRILDMDYDELYDMTKREGSYYVIVRKRVGQEKADEIRAYIKENKLQRGIYLEQDYQRVYPGGNFLSQVLGFVGGENSGLEGIELVYDTQMNGTPGRVITVVDGLGQRMALQNEKEYAAQDGLNVVLTIDSEIQRIVEKYLKEAVVEYQVENGACAIVMDVETGEILAMDTQGGYDPNVFNEIADPAVKAIIDDLPEDQHEAATQEALRDQRRNKAVVDSYEPGSTFKIITAAIALEEKVVSVDDTFECKGFVMLPGWNQPIQCSRTYGHGVQTFAQGVRNSCNPVFIETALRIGARTYYEYFKAFGFTEKTGVEIPGESKGVYHTWAQFNNQVTLATYSFGQTFTVTPIQLVTAVSAVANGGRLMKPQLVSALTDPDGNVVSRTQPEVVRHVLSPETSKELCGILETVVSAGTGQNAYVAGYRVAGKTGTGQKRDPATKAYMFGRYAVSFMAIAPADDPKIALLVMLDEPMSGPPNLRTGGGMAAPVAGRMLSEILPYLQVEPRYTEEELESVEITVPALRGLELADAVKLLGNIGLRYRIEGQGDKVISQVPESGVRAPGAAEIILYMEEGTPVETTVVPDVAGLSVKQAKKALEEAGLYMLATGATATEAAGVGAFAQDTEPGSEAPVGSVVQVEFRDMSLLD